MRGIFPCFARDRRGGVSIIAAFSSLMVVGFAAAAVDMGSIYLGVRSLQGVADMAAIAAARDLDKGAAAAQATADLSGWTGGVATETTLGGFDPNAAVAAGSRFQPGAAPMNAARVKAVATTPLYFSAFFLGKDHVSISRSATAARAELVSFSIGARLAALDATVANGTLSGLTGGPVKLSVMDYNALASADIDLVAYSKALRIRAGLETATFGNALDAKLSAPNALRAAADVLASSGQAASAEAVNKLAAAAGSAPNISMARLINLGPYAAQDHLAGGGGTEVSMRALDLATAVLMTGQGGRQIRLDLGITAPGLAGLDVWLAVGERPKNSPWIAVAQRGDAVIVRTAQARIYVEARTTSALGAFGIQPVVLPVLLDVAPSEAKLSTIRCPSTPADQGADLSVRTGVGEAWIATVSQGSLGDFGQTPTRGPAVLVDAQTMMLKAKATGQAHILVGGQSWQTASFTRDDISSSRIRSVSTGDIAQSVASSLLRNLDLKVSIVGIGLPVEGVTTPLSASLAQIAPPVDSALNALTDLIGVKVGQADVRLNGLRCREAALVS